MCRSVRTIGIHHHYLTSDLEILQQGGKNIDAAFHLVRPKASYVLEAND